jgi:hypothetical protein
VIVSAGDGFSDEAKVFWTLDYLLQAYSIRLVAVPMRIGLDAGVFPMVERWGQARQVRVIGERLADEELKKHGAQAHQFLHRQMLAKHKPERVVAFPGKGHVDELLNQARAAGVKSIEVA